MPPWCSGSRHCSCGSAPDTYWCECGGVCCVLATSEFGVLFVSAFAMSHPSRTFSLRLSKSRYTAGTQCQKLLWWKVHEPLAVELQPDKVLQDRFDQGSQGGDAHDQGTDSGARGSRAVPLWGPALADGRV